MMTHAITEALWGTFSALVLCGHVAYVYVVCKRNKSSASSNSESTPVASNAMKNYKTVHNEEATEKNHSL